MMKNTILFDLDGTLVSMDGEVFVKNYFKELSIKLKDYFTLEELTNIMWTSTQYMIDNSEVDKTNEEAFFECFYKKIKYSEEDLTPLFNEFYEKDFDSLQHVCEKNEYIVDSVKLLKEKNYDLVVATNPLFPRSAVIDRIKWAGLKEEDFIFIASFECMHFCKPNIEFYKEVLEKINCEPSNCIMVGNDIKEDMIIKEIGADTYLLKDFIIGDIKENENIDHSGDYKEFYEFVKELPKL